jgi:hypothetical protein
MRGRRTHIIVLLTAEERDQLHHWVRSTTTPVGLVRRATMVLGVADGQTFVAAAQTAGLTEKHGRKWINRFLQQRLEGLHDLPGRGRKPSFSPGGRPSRRQDCV